MADTKKEKKKVKQQNEALEFFSLLWRTKKIAFISMFVLAFFILVAIFADLIAPEKMVNGTLASHLIDSCKPPSLQHPFGTEAMGVDLLSYMVYGARTSVILGVSCTIISTIISVIIGVTSAVVGGKFDLLLQRFIDAWQCIPGMLIMLILMTILGSGMWQMIVVMSIPTGIGGSRMIRSAAISVKDSGYCGMSRMLGGKHLWRMIHHVVPNIMPLVLMNLANSLGGTIMMESTLNFLGFGVSVTTPSWAYLLTSQGRSKMYTSPWIGLAPGIAITIMVFAAAMFGDGVRDVLDPRLKGGMGSFSRKKIRRISEKYMADRVRKLSQAETTK